MILFLPNTKKELGLGNMRRCLLLKEQLEKKNLKCNIYLEKKNKFSKNKKNYNIQKNKICDNR